MKTKTLSDIIISPVITEKSTFFKNQESILLKYQMMLINHL